MCARRRSLPLFVLFLLFAEAGGGRDRPQTKPLLEPTRRPGSVKSERGPTVIRQRTVVVDLRQLKSPDDERLRLPLFGGTEIVLVRDRQETPRKDTVIWYGHVEGQPGSTAVLSNVKEALSGNVMTRDRAAKLGFYEIRYLGNRVHVLSEIDPSKFPSEGSPGEPKVPPVAPDADVCGGDPASIIDALAVYTGAARDAAGGTSGMEAEIYEAVGLTNQSYANSEIAQRLRLVHMEEVSYWESGNSVTDRDRLRDPADGYLDSVPILRNTYSADVAVLIVRSLDDCGRSNVMETVSHAFESFAYAVVRRNCSASNYSLAHELGHIMGARHDRKDDPTEGKPFAYNHGWMVKSLTVAVTPWRTIMAKDDGCNCTDRIPYWSNPKVPYPATPPGDPTGTADSDNHRVLNETALTVANFRCASPDVNNVWMKDSWNDTGAEPDPKTTGDVMWASPYIWVRNSRDTTNSHPHDHENPVAGSTNWVYVRLDNGGGTINGNLELYWASASTSLTWPSGWTLLATVPVSFAAGTSTKVVEVPWTPQSRATSVCSHGGRPSPTR